MQLLHLWQNNFVTISLDSNQLVCCLLHTNSKDSKKFILKDFLCINLQRSEIIDGIIHNPTFLVQRIKEFLQKNRISNAQVAMSICGKKIVEKISSTPNASPSSGDFGIPLAQSNSIQSIYLYPQESGNFAFYVCAIKAHHLLAYILLAINSNLQPVLITTPAVAAFNLYKSMQAHFLHSQLAADMQRADNNLTQLVSADQLPRYLIQDTHSAKGDTLDPHHLLNAVGLVISCNPNLK